MSPAKLLATKSTNNYKLTSSKENDISKIVHQAKDKKTNQISSVSGSARGFRFRKEFFLNLIVLIFAGSANEIIGTIHILSIERKS